MITDPDEPGYRYPEVGERLWHAGWRLWVRVEAHCVWPGASGADEVPVRLEATGGFGGLAKLGSLEERF